MADAPPSPQSHLSSNVAKCLSPPGDPAIGENCSSQGGHHDKDDNAMLHDTRQADPNGEENVREKIVNILRDWALWERSLEEVAERNGEARIIKHAADHGASPSAYVAPDATEHNVSSALGSSQDCPGTPFTTRSEDVAHDMTLGPNDGLHGGENVKLLRRPKQRQGIGDEGDELGEHELVSASQDCRSPSTILEGSLVREDAETSSALHPAQASSTGKAALRSPDQKRKPRRVLRSNTVEASPVWRREHNGLLRHRTDISRGKEGIPNNLEGIVSGWETTMNRPHQTAPMTRSHPAARVQRCRSERPSAWARSPSRGDIGGVLVKRGFYYGSGGNASLHRSSSRGPIDVARANSCPRRIGCNANRKRGRDEARQSGFWCEVRDGSNSGTEARRTLEAPSGSLADVAIVTRGGNRASRPRTTSRSDKARRKYDSPSHGSQDAVEAKKGGTSETVGVVSFDEQLRFTPLSQGAWLVDAASTRHVTHGTKGTSCKHHPQDLKEETGRRRRCCAATKGEGDEERGDVAGAQTDQGASENETRNCIAKDIGAGDNDARRMYDVILAKLRGEIDHLTREKIILHAAEDARRALARVRDLGASLGNPSAGKKEGSGSAEKQSNVRDVIDYDRVEATLSLIELATRAAGPDAGKQMLRALEDLDKIDQQSGMEEVKGTGQKGSAASIPAASRDPRWQAQEDAPEASMDGPPSMAISGRSQDTATVSGVLQAIGGWFQRDGKAKLQRANALESAEGFHGASGGEDIPREHLHHADRQRRVADPKEEDSADEATPRLRSSAGNQVRGDEEDEDQRHMAVGLWVPKVGERTPPEENICGIEVALGIDRSVNAQENEKLVYPGASVCEAVAEQPDGINSSSLEEFYLAWDGTGGDKRGDGPTIAKACVSATATDFPGVCSASSVEPPARTARETGNEQLGSSAPRRESLRQQSFSRNSRRGSGGGGHRLKKKYEIECSRGARGTGQELTSSVRGVQPTTRPSKGPAGRDSRRPASARSNITRQGQAAATRERSLMDAKRRPTTAPSKIETGSSRNMYARVERARVVPRGVCSGKRLCPKFDCGGAVPGEPCNL